MNDDFYRKEVMKHSRVDVADVLRGFAVMAIILLHSIEHFNFYQFPDAATRGAFLPFLDKAIWDGLFFAFGGKAYAIFALLFGFSFFIQDDNQRMKGVDFRLRFCWRLVLLFVIAQFNAAFFTGEILLLYSLVGFVLVLTCRLSTKTLVVLGSIFMLQPVSIYYIARVAADPTYTVPSLNTGAFWGATYAMQDAGSFWETVKVNLWEGQLASLGWAWEHGRVFQTAALFIFGMLIGRNGWFLKKNLQKWQRALAVALVAFFPLHGLDNMVGDYVADPQILGQLKLIISSLANVAFMMILVCGVMVGYYCTRRLSRLLALLIPYGRMSMTNYVTQGMIGAVIFYNWGFHLHAGTAESELIGIAIFIAQWYFCRWWLKARSHGPFEYVWKRATWAI